MTSRPISLGLRIVVPPTAALACLLLVGCESGPGSSSGLPQLKNPFAQASKGAEQPTRAPKKEVAVKVGPDFMQTMGNARQNERSGKLDQAREAYQKMIVKYPQRSEPYHRLGVVADRQKRYREAQALYSQAISIKPSAEVFNDLGYCLYLQGKLEKAESALRKSVSMMPSNSRFRNNLGMVYGHQGRYDKAMEEFRRGGSEADAYYNMAFILAGREDVDGAKDCFRLALAADPSHEKALSALKSFDEPDRGAERLAAEGGRRWENYVESRPSGTSDVAQQASYVAPAKTSATKASAPLVPSTRPDTQALLRRARSMMSERMTTQ